jgi:hypothetical protein
MLSKREKIGENTLLEKVGSGGFGDVWQPEKQTALDFLRITFLWSAILPKAGHWKIGSKLMREKLQLKPKPLKLRFKS